MMTKLIDGKNFRAMIDEAIGDNSFYVFYSASGTMFYADYRPCYPSKSAADFLISYNWIDGTATLSAETACVPIIEKFDTFDSLIERIKTDKEVCSNGISKKDKR